jgi:potassium voltage-gated channel Eag-related subfamily H protein 7
MSFVASKARSSTSVHPGESYAMSSAILESGTSVFSPKIDSNETGWCKLSIFNPISQSSKRWDGLVAVLLIYTAYVTPFEVGFLEPAIDTAPSVALFSINRFVDVVFMFDLIRSFFTPYFNAMEQYWVVDQKKIIRRYVTTWFPIDFVSVLPFDTVGVAVQSDTVSQMKAARVIRLFRLLKLLRLVRSTASLANF